MKKGLSRPAKIGIFSISMAVLLYLGINFIKSKKIFSGDNVFYAEYNSADGIEVSSPVVIKGFKVGTVDKITFDIHKSTVIVKMSVSSQYPIPDNSKAKIAAASLLGGKLIDINLGDSHTDLTDGAHIATIQEQGLLEMASGEYEKLKEMATTLVEQLNSALKGINAVLSKDNVKNISETIANLNSMSGNINKIVASQKNNIEGMIANLNEVSKTLKNEIPKLSVTIDNLNQLSGDLKKSAPELLANASSAIDNLNVVLANIKDSKGTVGKLINQNEVYDNLNKATSALTELLEDLKENPKRYINISVFGGGNKDKKK